MQRRLVTWLAAVILIAHGLLGCCWHHRHVHDSAGSDLHRAVQSGPETVTEATAHLPVRRTCCHHGHHQTPAKLPMVPDAERHALASTTGHHTESPVEPSPAEPSPDSPCTEDDCVFVAGSRGAVGVEQADCSPRAFPAVDWASGPSCLQRVAVDVAGSPRDRDTGADLGGWRVHRARTGVWLI